MLFSLCLNNIAAQNVAITLVSDTLNLERVISDTLDLENVVFLCFYNMSACNVIRTYGKLNFPKPKF